jgi:hypothetical protein
VDGLDNDEEQATVATREESTIDVVARVVDTEEENRRLREQDRMRHEQDRMRHERDQAVRELDQLRQLVDNAVIVSPVVATDRDVENGDEDVHANDGDLPKSDDHKCGTKGRQWIAIGVIFLIVVAVTVALALVLPSEPTAPVPTTPVSTTQDPTTAGPTTPLNDLLSSVSSDDGAALNTPSTPQNKALKWLEDDTNLESYSDETIIQRYALATLYYSANGDSWHDNTLWLDSGEECGRWHGLSCTTSGIATQLNLGFDNLRGTLPPEIGLMKLLGECVT